MSRVPKNVALLAGCQAVHVTGTSLLIAIGALVGLAVAPDPRLATLPIGLQSLVAMATTMPASLLMKRIGRRAGFTLGVLSGAAGAALSAIAVQQSSFPLLCLGASLLGVLLGTGQYYRFAAADAVDTFEQPRAIALVLGGGLVAAFVGPNLASLTRDAFAGPEFIGSYVALALLQVVALALLAWTDLPAPTSAEQAPGGRPLVQLARQPRYALAVLAAVVAYATMSLLMTATPLAMGGHGFVFHHTASVIQWHAVGMFAPAFFSGNLVQRFGTLRVMIAGCTVLLASVVTNLSGHSLWHFWIALACLGVGWNLLYVAASSLLTRTYTPAEKARAQGFNDLLVFATITLTATTAGALHATIGWRTMNIAALPAVLLVMGLATRTLLRRRRPTTVTTS